MSTFVVFRFFKRKPTETKVFQTYFPAVDTAEDVSTAQSDDQLALQYWLFVARSMHKQSTATHTDAMQQPYYVAYIGPITASGMQPRCLAADSRIILCMLYSFVLSLNTRLQVGLHNE